MQSFTVCFLLPLIFTVHAEVVTTFQGKCDEFFYNKFEPQLDASTNYVRICQRFENQYHFATLYDKVNRIPVYSAYKYSRDDGKCKRDKNWRIEPQLDDQNWDKNMMTEGELRNEHSEASDAKIGTHQALDSDYKNTGGYDRGHLNPVQHHEDDDCIATFTLTNAVPQHLGLNRGFWRVYEKDTHLLFQTCKTAYVLVGATPSNNKVNNRVNIPDLLWHAYCCLDDKDRPTESRAAHVKNAKTRVVECSVKDLEKELGNGVKLFNNCDPVPSGASASG